MTIENTNEVPPGAGVCSLEPIVGLLTADGKVVAPERTRLYFYPSWATDEVPCYGLPIFDNEAREWHPYHGKKAGPMFATRKAVNDYIALRSDAVAFRPTGAGIQ